MTSYSGSWTKHGGGRAEGDRGGDGGHTKDPSATDGQNIDSYYYNNKRRRSLQLRRLEPDARQEATAGDVFQARHRVTVDVRVDSDSREGLPVLSAQATVSSLARMTTTQLRSPDDHVQLDDVHKASRGVQ